MDRIVCPKLLQSCLTLVTTWTVACQAPLFMGRIFFQGKNTEMGCHFLLQEIFPTQGSNPISCIGRQVDYH